MKNTKEEKKIKIDVSIAPYLNFKKLREKNNYSFQSVARLAKMEEHHYYEIEENLVLPTEAELYTLLDILNQSLTYQDKLVISNYYSKQYLIFKYRNPTFYRQNLGSLTNKDSIYDELKDKERANSINLSMLIYIINPIVFLGVLAYVFLGLFPDISRLDAAFQTKDNFVELFTTFSESNSYIFWIIGIILSIFTVFLAILDTFNRSYRHNVISVISYSITSVSSVVMIIMSVLSMIREFDIENLPYQIYIFLFSFGFYLLFFIYTLVLKVRYFTRK